MTSFQLSRRSLIKATGAAAGAATLGMSTAVKAQTTPIKFILDWRFEGPAAPWLLTAEKGYFRQEGLDVQIDVGAGSAAGVQRMAAGAYDMTHSDFNTMIELNATIPDPQMRPVGFYVTYDNHPATVFTLRRTGITKPKDLEGRKIGAPAFDGGRKAFPVLARANNIDLTKINWTTMDPPLRETMLVRGEVEAITGFYFSGFLSLLGRGAAESDIVAMRYADFGARMYGSTAVTTPRFAAANPRAVAAFAKAFNRGLKETIANPDASIEFVKKRDGLIDERLETRRLRMMLDNFLVTPDVRTANALGALNPARLAQLVDQVTPAFNLQTRVDPATLFNASFLPPAAERRITG
jgi:NitT/TauT family transport system substrate-binding protein